MCICGLTNSISGSRHRDPGSFATRFHVLKLLLDLCYNDIYAWQSVAEKSAMHIGSVIFFCTAAVHGDTLYKIN